jgi:PIN domain nuclease of toxin-antitoxin system
MSQPLLLDTCATIWLANDEPVSPRALELLHENYASGGTTFVSPMTAWEIGMLVARGRISLPATPQRWFKRVMEAPGLRLAEMTQDILIASSFLPGQPPRDPADRIIAATARECGYRLVTRDRPLLEYAGQGHIHALEC